MSEAKYLRTSEHEEAVRSLEWASRQAKELAHDPYYWKWVLISIHNAAQGFMVLARWNGNGLLAMPGNLAAKWLKAYREEKPLPDDQLDRFLNLYAKCKAPENFNYCGSVAFKSTVAQDASFKDLNDFRNEFIHFTPKGWSLKLNDLPALVKDVLDLVQFFGWQTTAILWHEASHKVRARWAYRSLRRTMAALSATYA